MAQPLNSDSNIDREQLAAMGGSELRGAILPEYDEYKIGASNSEMLQKQRAEIQYLSDKINREQHRVEVALWTATLQSQLESNVSVERSISAANLVVEKFREFFKKEVKDDQSRPTNDAIGESSQTNP